MYCVSKQLAIGTETLTFGRKVKIKHVLLTGAGANSAVTLTFDQSGPYPFSTTWQIMRLLVTVLNSSPFQITDLDIECRDIILTVTGATRVTFFYEWKWRGKKSKK